MEDKFSRGCYTGSAVKRCRSSASISDESPTVSATAAAASHGRTVGEATGLYRRMKDLENAGAYAAELEIVPHNLARFLCSQTKLILMSLGSGGGCDTQFLFSDDILCDYDERPPRHAKAYRNFSEEHRRLQVERIAAFREYISDVNEGRFPERSHLVEMETHLLDELVCSIPPR